MTKAGFCIKSNCQDNIRMESVIRFGIALEKVVRDVFE
jgi:hypothetical protein